MAYREPPFVWEQFSVSGPGSITTSGPSALPSGELGALPFVSGGVGASDGSGNLAVGDTFPYEISGTVSGSREMGIATITALSTTNNTITFTRGVIFPKAGAVSFSEVCNVFVTRLPGVTSSAGAADANKPAILGPGGVLDSSLVAAAPSFNQGPWKAANYLGIGNGLTVSDDKGYGFALPKNNQTYVAPFKWVGNFPIKRVSIWVTTAGTPVSPATTCAIRFCIYSYVAAGSATLLYEPTATNPFDGSSVGAKSLVAPTDFTEFTLPPGMYLIGLMSADATNPPPSLAASDTLYTGEMDGFFGLNAQDYPYVFAKTQPYNSTPQAASLLPTITQGDILNVSPAYQQFIKVWMGAQ